MRVRFLGVMERSTKKSGCSRCGNRVTTSQGLVRKTVKTFALPSGLLVTARAGQILDLDDSDGLYLSQLTYQIDNEVLTEFEVV